MSDDDIHNICANLPFEFSSQEFVDDYNRFTERIADLDRRLASIVCQGFDDCSGTEAALKVTIATIVCDSSSKL